MEIQIFTFRAPDEGFIAATAISLPDWAYDIRSGPDSGWSEYMHELEPLSAHGKSRQEAKDNLIAALKKRLAKLEDVQIEKVTIHS